MGKCIVCKKEILEQDEIIYYGNSYCSICHAEKVDYDNMMWYAGWCMNGRAWPQDKDIAIQRNIAKKNGYTSIGTMQALQYWCEVQKKPLKSFAILPYIYDDAIEYFKKMAELQKVTAEQLSTELLRRKRIKVVVCENHESNKKTKYDLSAIGEDDI